MGILTSAHDSVLDRDRLGLLLSHLLILCRILRVRLLLSKRLLLLGKLGLLQFL